jgi:hypothetical protein
MEMLRRLLVVLELASEPELLADDWEAAVELANGARSCWREA